MNATQWSDVLDEYEARLSAQTAALAAGGTPVLAPFVPPDTVPDLPAELTDRATALVQRCRAIERDIAEALAAAGAALERLSTAPPPAAGTQPVYFDSRV